VRGWTTRKRELDDAIRLEFGVGVRADFAVQVDFFVLRGYPFHGGGSLEKTSATRARIARIFRMGNGVLLVERGVKGVPLIEKAAALKGAARGLVAEMRRCI